MISERISDDIPPQMKTLNMIITILMHFCSLSLNHSRRVVVNYKRKYVHEALVNRLVKQSMVS